MEEAKLLHKRKLENLNEGRRRVKIKKLLGDETKAARFKLLRALAYEYMKMKFHGLCHNCHKFVEREDFSLEHIIPWMNSFDPKRFFYDVQNLTISHISCNAKRLNFIKKPKDNSKT